MFFQNTRGKHEIFVISTKELVYSKTVGKNFVMAKKIVTSNIRLHVLSKIPTRMMIKMTYLTPSTFGGL